MEQRAIGVAGQVAQPIGRWGEGSREGGRGQVAERRKRTHLVIAGGPTRQRRFGVIEIVEDRFIEQFAPHSPVVRLALQE